MTGVELVQTDVNTDFEAVPRALFPSWPGALYIKAGHQARAPLYVLAGSLFSLWPGLAQLSTTACAAMVGRATQ